MNEVVKPFTWDPRCFHELHFFFQEFTASIISQTDSLALLASTGITLLSQSMQTGYNGQFQSLRGTFFGVILQSIIIKYIFKKDPSKQYFHTKILLLLQYLFVKLASIDLQLPTKPQISAY